MTVSLLLTIAQMVPWYLFPGTGNATVTDSVKTETPAVIAAKRAVARRPAVTSEDVRLCLTMPFNATGASPNRWAFDFYCGALMAADEITREGVSLTIDVFDCADSLGSKVPTSEPFRYDIMLGPVSKDEISDLAAICPSWQPVISPLDGSLASLMDKHYIIQVPTSAEAQAQDLVNWVLEDFDASRDTVVVIQGEGNTFPDALQSKGIPYVTATPAMPLDQFCPKNGTARFFIDSDDEATVSNEIRRISVLSMMRHKVALYCPSKARAYENLSVELLHSCSAHLSSTYDIDYSDPAIYSFVNDYRRRFNCEPTQFAFHGYDCVRYFTAARVRFGAEWTERLSEFCFRGLQADFRFSGNRNLAARRLVYNPDFSITRQK